MESVGAERHRRPGRRPSERERVSQTPHNSNCSRKQWRGYYPPVLIAWTGMLFRDHGNCTYLVALVSATSFECAVHMPHTSSSYEMRQRQDIYGSAEPSGFRPGTSRH